MERDKERTQPVPKSMAERLGIALVGKLPLTEDLMKKYKLQRLHLHPISEQIKKTGVYFEFPDRKLLNSIPEIKTMLTAELS